MSLDLRVAERDTGEGAAHFSRVVGFSDSRDCSRVARVSIEFGSFLHASVKLLACHGYALSKMRKNIDARVRRGERLLVRGSAEDRDTIC